MPKFAASYIDGYTAGRYLRQERERVFQQAQVVVQTCETLSHHDAHYKQITTKLFSYLLSRMQESIACCNNNAEIDKRTQYIRQLAEAFQNQDYQQQALLLRETEIRGFKGFFSQRLYNILVEYRENLALYNPAPARAMRMGG